MRNAKSGSSIFVVLVLLSCVSGVAAPQVNPSQKITGGMVSINHIPSRSGEGDTVIQDLRAGPNSFSLTAADMSLSTLRVNGSKIAEINGPASFVGVWRNGAHVYVVLSESLGGAADPPNYQIIDSTASSVVMSPDLGQSSKDVKVKVVDGALQISMSHSGTEPDRTILFVNGKVEQTKTVSSARNHFEQGQCVSPRAGDWVLFKAPRVGSILPGKIPNAGLFVASQVPGWTGLSTSQENKTLIGWARTSTVMDVALRNCINN